MHFVIRLLALAAIAAPYLASAQVVLPPEELTPSPGTDEQQMSSMSGEPAQPWIEYEKRVNAEQRLTAFGPNLLGDSIDPSTGQISFEHTDVALPGNSKLDVSIRRRVTQSYLYDEAVDAEFGNWQHVVPRLVVVTRSAQAGGWTGNRCSNGFGQTGFPKIVRAGSNPVEYIYAPDYSNGLQLETPGEAPQQLLGSPGGAGWPAGTGYVTAKNWAFSCVTAYTYSGAVDGQGMLGYAPDGTRYEFNRYINRPYRKLGVMLASKSVGTPRSKSLLVATKVTDVYGNWVKYDYDSQGRLTKIHSNDGRRIDLAYQLVSYPKLVTQVTANPGLPTARTWNYSYRGTAQSKPFWEGGTAINMRQLGSVQLPDGLSWVFQLDGLLAEPTPGECYTFADYLVVTHPYGVVGTFILEEARHRMGLYDMMEYTFDCPSGEPSPPPTENPTFVTQLYDTMSVTSKRLEGPGLAPAEWHFTYEVDTAPAGSDSAPPDNVPAKTNWTKIAQPDGSEIKYYHRWQYDPIGGMLGGILIKKEIRQTPASQPLEITEHKDSGSGAGSDGVSGYVVEPSMGPPLANLNSNVGLVKALPDRVVISRGYGAAQFDTFTTDYIYNNTISSAQYSFGLPIQLIETSSTAPSLVRDTKNTYLHDKTLWIIGLQQKIERKDDITSTYKEFEFNEYDPLKRHLSTHRRFGVTKATYTYNPDGTVATIKDPLNNIWTLSSWARGKPQLVTRPDQTTFSRVVDDNGWVTSETDGRGFTTALQYNAMGWLTLVNRPLAHADTSISYSLPQLPIQAVHTLGAQRTTVSYDAMLRAKQVEQFALDGSADAVYEQTRYDIEGRATYKSRPFFGPSNPNVEKPGVKTEYDALGRVTKAFDTVSPGTVKTETAYLSNLTTRVTDPTGAITSATSRAFGTPANPEIMQVIDAMGGVTDTVRYIFGNVRTLTQSGTQYGYAASATREFWYDNSLRLCRHRAPEFGDELFEYYDNDKLRYSSRGETAAIGCAATSAALRTELTYDNRGRLTTTNFPSTTPDISVGYDNESNRTSLTRGATAWTFGYNAIGQPLFEQLVMDARTYRFDYGYNANDHLSTRSRQGGTSVTYGPDAFGRPTKIAVGGVDYVHSVSYLENGLVGSGTFANGYVLTQALDLFGYQHLEDITVAKPGGATAVSRTHTYDVRSQVESIIDLAVPSDSRSFQYDAKGRLCTATGPWGSGSFEYDALDNLRKQTLGARIVDLTSGYNPTTNRIDSVTDSGVPRVYGYDVRGNATLVGGMSFTYDFSNQPNAVLGAAVALYTYDGNLKRVKSVANGKTTYWIYPAAGGVTLQDNVTDGKLSEYLAVGALTVRLINGANPEYTHGDHLGSSIAATDASGVVTWRESYNPFGEARVKPVANASNTGYTGHVQDDYSGLTYMQARYYDPLIGRFLSVDPIGYQDQINLYAYVGNNPVNRIDPYGLTQFDCSGGSGTGNCGGGAKIQNGDTVKIAGGMTLKVNIDKKGNISVNGGSQRIEAGVKAGSRIMSDIRASGEKGNRIAERSVSGRVGGEMRGPYKDQGGNRDHSPAPAEGDDYSVHPHPPRGEWQDRVNKRFSSEPDLPTMRQFRGTAFFLIQPDGGFLMKDAGQEAQVLPPGSFEFPK
jgi:RHS repeat-associated protein